MSADQLGADQLDLALAEQDAAVRAEAETRLERRKAYAEHLRAGGDPAKGQSIWGDDASYTVALNNAWRAMHGKLPIPYRPGTEPYAAAELMIDSLGEWFTPTQVLEHIRERGAGYGRRAVQVTSVLKKNALAAGGYALERSTASPVCYRIVKSDG